MALVRIYRTSHPQRGRCGATTAITARRRSCVLPVALALVLLPAIAPASPPDPSWVVGIYDGADGDDVVTLIADNAATAVGMLLQIPPPLPLSEAAPALLLDAIHAVYVGQSTRSPPVFGFALDRDPALSHPAINLAAGHPPRRLHGPSPSHPHVRYSERRRHHHGETSS
jgi:hypothetical protein